MNFLEQGIIISTDYSGSGFHSVRKEVAAHRHSMTYRVTHSTPPPPPTHPRIGGEEGGGGDRRIHARLHSISKYM